MRWSARTILATLLASLFVLGGSSSCRKNSRPAGTLVISVEKNPVSFDPLRGTLDAVTAHILQLIYDPLVRKNDRFEIVPNIADFEVSEDQKTYTFTLKHGVKFHNGRELTSKDVKYTFDQLLADSPLKGAFQKLSGIEIVDSHTLVFHAKEAFPDFLGSCVALGIMPDDSAATIAAHPVGTGPFRFTSFLETQEMRLDAFNDYWNGQPSIRHVLIKVVPDASVRQLEILNHSVDLDLNSGFSPDTVESFAHTPGIKVTVTDGTTLGYIPVNLKDPITSNREVRQAIAYGLDLNSILSAVWRGQARRAYGVLPPQQWAFDPSAPKYDYDPERAKKLLDGAHFPDPDGDGPKMRLQLAFATSSAAFSRQIASIFQDQLKRIGIDLDLQSFETSTFLDNVRRGQFQLGYSVFVGGNEQPDFFRYIYHSKSIPTEQSAWGGGNRSRYNNPKMDSLIETAEGTIDREKQKAAYLEIQSIASGDLPLIPLWYRGNVAITSARVENVVPDLSGSWFFIKDLKLSE